MPGRQNDRVLSTEVSYIPGETEEDGDLRREYVLVDNTRAVEFNRAVDGKSDHTNYNIARSLKNSTEISSQPRRPLYDRRVIPTPTTYDYASEYPLSPTVNSPTTSNIGATSPIAINNITFPPPPNSSVPPLSSSPSSTASRAATNALNRALSIASKKLFGHSHSHSRSHSSSRQSRSSPPRDLSAPSSPRRPQLILSETDGERDPLENELLGLLEELAQKTDVLTHWADEMYEYVKAIPQSQYFLPFIRWR